VEHKLEKILACPVCKGKEHKKHIEGKDHNVTGETFTITECKGCEFRFTNPRPKEKYIYKYYQSKSYISHSSTKKGLINKTYHLVRSYQFYKKKKAIQKKNNVEKGKILDIGCGTGDFLKYMDSSGWEIDGVETDKGARIIAEKKLNKKIKEKLNLFNEENKYDVITMWHVLEHVYNVEGYLKKINKLLKKGGFVVIGIPNCNSYDAKKYKENWVAYDLPIHLSHFRKKDIKKLAKKNKFELKDIKPLFFDAYYIGMLSSNKSGSTSVLGFLHGLFSNLKAKSTGEYSSLMYFLFK
jgi:2-polyprenyl-3-methyl-5-hydroxy-6-metoxy-1,4-benzoquinol methylase|tara:strand:- start:1573 stop:2460 length:888 start_codon:yes stop_codon:yes gene_type:complete